MGVDASPRRLDQNATSTIEERHAIFEKTLLEGGCCDEIGRRPVYVNKDILACYRRADTDWMERERYVERYRYEHLPRFKNRGMSNGLPDWAVHRDAGNYMFWALKLGIVAEEVRDGIRGWRLVSREPIWVVDYSRPGARLFRLQGGTPAEQQERARLERLNQTRERLRATLARKACAKATTDIGDMLTRILKAEPEFQVPKHWCATGYVPKGFSGAYLSACSPTIRDACVAGDFDKRKLWHWTQHLSSLAASLEKEAFMRRRAAEEAAQSEDDQALASLGDLGGHDA